MHVAYPKKTHLLFGRSTNSQNASNMAASLVQKRSGSAARFSFERQILNNETLEFWKYFILWNI